MLPLITRNRKIGSETISDDIAVKDMMSGMKNTSKRFQRISLKAKCFFIFFLLLAIYIYGTVFWAWHDNRLTKEDFLGTDKCPVCYGRSMCFELFDNQLELKGLSKMRALDVINVRNVHLAYHKEKELNVVLKKLAHDKELNDIDVKICADSFRNPGCDVARTAILTKTSQDIVKNGFQPKHLKDSSFMFMCPTHKLLNKVVEMYQEKTRENDLVYDDILHIWYTAKVNAEPLLLQTFPKSKGWPFPEYYGACGRYVAVENGGKTLGDYYNAAFYRRADLAYQLLQIAQKFTDNPDFALYWTDLAYDNFAVDPAGKVIVIDAEHIIVVDREATKIANAETWNDIQESDFDKCDEENHSRNCLTFNADKLCTHYHCDHNYYALCRNLLSQYADEPEAGRMDGLLHHMPEKAKETWDLENLLNECANPHQPQGRIKVIPHLLEALDHLRFAPLKEDTEKTDNR